MSVRRAAIYAYQIPLTPAPLFAGQPLAQRHGWILELEQDGRKGYGEAAPLPGFSPETLEQSFNCLRQQAERWLHTDSAGAKPEAANASARFGFSCAVEELNRGPLFSPLADHPCQPLLTDPGQISEAPLVKLKLGRRALTDEIEWLGRLIDHNPAIQLRIDCNRSWTLTQGRQFLEAVPNRAIDYLEEPCQTLEYSLLLAEQFDVGLALDESLIRPGFNLPSSPQIKALVLKPTLIGSIGQLVSWINKGRQRQLQTVLSSSYESSLGLGQIAALADRYCPGQVVGLDTAGCFTAQLLRSLNPEQPRTQALLTPSELECRWHS